MSLSKKTLISTLLLTSQMVHSIPSLSLTNSIWKYNKQAAYSLQHDDYCAGSEKNINEIAAPALLERGLTASFGIIASRCSETSWKQASKHVASGLTLFNHSMNHYAAFKPTWDKNELTTIWDSKVEIDSVNQIIKEKTGFTPLFMGLPFDIATDEVTQYVRDHDELIAMRAPGENNGKWVGNVGINRRDFSDAYALRVELYHNWSPYWKLGENKRLSAFLDDVINQAGFGIQYFHGIEDSSYYSVPKAEYFHLLDKLKKYSDEGLVWVADAAEIVKYRFARENYQLIENSKTDSSITFSVQKKNNVKEHVQLTAIGQFDKPVSKIKQAGKLLTFIQKEGVLQFEYETDKGDIHLIY